MKKSQVWVNFITIVLLLGLVGLSVYQLDTMMSMQETVEKVESDTKQILNGDDTNENHVWGRQTFVIGGV